MTALPASKSRKQSSPFPGQALPPLGKRHEAGQGEVGIEGRERHFTAVRNATFCGEPAARRRDNACARARLVWPWPALEGRDAAAARPFSLDAAADFPANPSGVAGRKKRTKERGTASAPGSGWRSPVAFRADDDSEKAESGSLSTMGTARRDPLFAGRWARLASSRLRMQWLGRREN
jgi:hypothetical protein